MDIRHLSARMHPYTAHNAGATQPQPSAAGESAAAAAIEATPATEAAAQQPATTPHLSRAGRLLNVLQSIEQRHPEETKKILGSIADKLRSDAGHAGVWGSRLEGWADRFQKAADSGDLSNLLPRLQPASHFGLRAYQQAQQGEAPEPETEADAIVAQAADAALSQSSPLAGGVGAETLPDTGEPQIEASAPSAPEPPAVPDTPELPQPAAPAPSSLGTEQS